MIGSTLSHYKITAELGRGGMGIVYRAQDTKLNREVAIKVLPSAALATEDDRARFYREAQAAAQLHHAHIATIFEIDEAVPSDAPHGTQASPFIVMEYIEGETLESRVKQGPLKLSEAVRIAIEMAEALKAAHGKDIVHRDIKSANVMLTAEGSAKVLDFGLAKTAQSTQLTRLGSTLGTVSYMSPEQARSEAVDARTDLWALGVTLYEMITGSNPFGGDYEQAVVYSILNEEPEPLTGLRTGVPLELEALVSKSLRKDRDHRYQSAAGIIADLKSIQISSTSGLSRSAVQTGNTTDKTTGIAPHEPVSRFRSMTIGSVIALFALLIGWFIPTLFSSEESDSLRRFFQYETDLDWIDIAPDGSKYAYVRTDTLWVRSFDSSEPAVVAVFRQDFRLVFWSPNSDEIGYIDNRELWTSKNDGRDVVRIATLPPSERTETALWTPEGDILVSVQYGGANGELFRIPSRGGRPVSEKRFNSTENFVQLFDMALLNSGKLIGVVNSGAGRVITLVNPITDQDREVNKLLLEATSEGQDPIFSIAFDPSGFLLYDRRLDTWVMKIDPNTGAPLSTPAILFPGVFSASVSSSGTIVALEATTRSVDTEMVEFDPQKETMTLTQLGISRSLRWPLYSNDGKQIAGWTNGIVIVDPSRKNIRQVVGSGAGISDWLPGDTRVLLSIFSDSTSQGILYALDPAGRKEPAIVLDLDQSAFYAVLSPEEKTLMYYQVDPDTGRDLWVAEVTLIDGDLSIASEPREWLVGPADDAIPLWHPSGKWIAHISNESGQYQVYIRPYPEAAPEIRVSPGKGYSPQWGPDGKSIYYQDDDSLYVVNVEDVSSMRLSSPRGLISLRDERIILESPLERLFTIHPGTGRLLMGRYVNEPPPSKITFIENWKSVVLED